MFVLNFAGFFFEFTVDQWSARLQHYKTLSSIEFGSVRFGLFRMDFKFILVALTAIINYRYCCFWLQWLILNGGRCCFVAKAWDSSPLSPIWHFNSAKSIKFVSVLKLTSIDLFSTTHQRCSIIWIVNRVLQSILQDASI